MRLGLLSDKQYTNGRVRDGTPTHATASCENNGGCPWCEGNRTFSTRSRLLKVIYNEGEN